MHAQIIELIIAYTLVGAFVFTVIVTLLSMVGWIKFADKAQQTKLFSILIVELIIGVLGFFFNFLNYSPAGVHGQIQEEVRNESAMDTLSSYVQVLTDSFKSQTPPDYSVLEAEIALLKFPADSEIEKERTAIIDVFTKAEGSSPEEIFMTEEQIRHRIEAFVQNAKVYFDQVN
ncbi:MAG: hypothetical protein K8S87_06080 [Planctomycetes bacterium]|nr:hypothetical protein [Planctomycetota bacterium]